MKTKTNIFAAGLLLLLASGQAQAVLIDFELNAPPLFSDQVALTIEFAGSGVKFSGKGKVLNMNDFPFKARSGTDALAFNSSAQAGGPETIAFDAGQSMASMWVANAKNNDVTLQLFDAAGVLIATIVQAVGTSYAQVSASVAGSNIRSVTITSADSVWAVDDLEFTASASAPGSAGSVSASVPAPGTLALAGLAVLGLIGSARKRAA